MYKFGRKRLCYYESPWSSSKVYRDKNGVYTEDSPSDYDVPCPEYGCPPVDEDL